MKKLSLLCSFLLVASIMFAGPKPFKRLIQDGCNGDYASRTIPDPDWDIVRCYCSPDCTGCPTSASTMWGDATDQAAADFLFDYADLQVANLIPSGTHTVHYSVVGESTLRTYNITWTHNDLENQTEQILIRVDESPTID